MILARVIQGNEYIEVGRVGKATLPNELGLVMFYTIEGEYPYRICLPKELIAYE
jgi:hypothetical protein